MALNGIDTSCDAASSETPSGTGTRPAAGATMSSAQAPKLPPVATRWPTSRPSTPSPSASTTPTASVPARAGISGLKP